jgi:soluble lytic murein transglycosylase-like protein
MNIKLYWPEILVYSFLLAVVFTSISWHNSTTEDSKLTKLTAAQVQFQQTGDLQSFIAYGRVLDTTITSLSTLRDSLQERFYYKLSQEAGRKYGINWKILYSVWMRESRMDPNARGDGRKDSLGTFVPGTWKAFGLGQVHVASAKMHYDKAVTKERLLDPIENGYASAAILRDYIAIFKDPIYGVASYQAGPANIDGDFKAKKAPRNWRYVSDVLVLAAEVHD